MQRHFTCEITPRVPWHRRYYLTDKYYTGYCSALLEVYSVALLRLKKWHMLKDTRMTIFLILHQMANEKSVTQEKIWALVLEYYIIIFFGRMQRQPVTPKPYHPQYLPCYHLPFINFFAEIINMMHNIVPCNVVCRFCTHSKLWLICDFPWMVFAVGAMRVASSYPELPNQSMWRNDVKSDFFAYCMYLENKWYISEIPLFTLKQSLIKYRTCVSSGHSYIRKLLQVNGLD